MSHKGGVSISEDDQTDSDASSAADANEHMAAADMQIVRSQQDRVTNFTESLINLVSLPRLSENQLCCCVPMVSLLFAFVVFPIVLTALSWPS